VTGLIWIYILLWFGLMVFLAAGTTWFQGYIYSEPVAGIAWRAPAAATAVTLFVLCCAFLDSREPVGRFPALFEFSPTDEIQFNELAAVKEGKTIHFKAEKNAVGQIEYRDAGKRRLGRVDEIIVKEDDTDVHFKAEVDDKGRFKVERGGVLRYVEVDGHGRIMTEDFPGRVASTRTGLLVVNVLLSLLHLGVWFACLWLLLQFQWPHALGFAAIFWLVMTLAILPAILRKVESQAKQQPAVQGEVWLDRFLPTEGEQRCLRFCQRFFTDYQV
jgi:hypothetical protein